MAAAGVEPPELQQLSRITPRSLIGVALAAVIAFRVVTLLDRVDFADLWETLRSANPAWFVAAGALAPLVQALLALSTIGASVTRLPYPPVAILQYAIQFISVALPAAAARLTLEVRFFPRLGIAAAIALSIWAIDSAAGFVVELLLIGLILVTGRASWGQGYGLLGDANLCGAGTLRLLLFVVLLVVALVTVTFAVPALRRRLRETTPRVLQTLRDQVGLARSAIAVLRQPRKIGLMISGNIGPARVRRSRDPRRAGAGEHRRQPVGRADAGARWGRSRRGRLHPRPAGDGSAQRHRDLHGGGLPVCHVLRPAAVGLARDALVAPERVRVVGHHPGKGRALGRS